MEHEALTFDLQRHKLHLPPLLAGGASGVGQKWLPTLETGGGREEIERERGEGREREGEGEGEAGMERERDYSHGFYLSLVA